MQVIADPCPDFHPDGYYKPGTSDDVDCHRGKGSAGYFGAEGTDCDAPMSLANETLRWIEKNLKDSIDFVVWTGDSARHDYDEKIPRTEDEVFYLQRFLTQGFIAALSDNTPHRNPGRNLSIPIIPTIGNNDVMPHNIFKPAPNKWTTEFLDIWSELIPETQRHSFVHGGWFTTEVIPNKLAVISLNTMYFFASNTAVDGCNDKSEPGYEHMEWLRVQLKLLRGRQMKAILIGHVPPARSGSKRNWDETCWQKYNLWLHRYRDVVAGSLYGHMNIDHFMFQDSNKVKILGLEEEDSSFDEPNESPGFSIQSRAGYLSSLREQWAKLPSPPQDLSLDMSSDDEWHIENSTTDDQAGPQKSKKKMKRFLKRVGGHWLERYSMSHVSPSVVPGYFPSLRVIEYNITGLEDAPTWADTLSNDSPLFDPHSFADEEVDDSSLMEPDSNPDAGAEKKKKKKKGKKKGKKKKKPKFKAPEPPSSSSPPGPAYSNQPLTWLGYTQYYANLTRINREVAGLLGPSERDPARLTNKDTNRALHDIFYYEVEYNTRNDKFYKLKDLTVRSYFKLARQIAKNDPSKERSLFTDNEDATPATLTDESSVEDNQAWTNGSLPGTVYPERKKYKNQLWRTFLHRAFVGFLDVDELEGVDE